MSAFHDNMLLGASGAGGGYQIERSLRFNSADSAYLNRTPASAGNRKMWTWSGWVKRSALESRQAIFATSDSAGGDYAGLEFAADDKLVFRGNDGSGAEDFKLETNAVFRDPSGWYHIVAFFNTGQAAASDRAAIYVNNVLQSYSTAAYMPLNYDGRVNAAVQHNIGAWLPATGLYLSGYLTEIHFIDGQALTASSFGEINPATGVWRPKRYSGTYGTNGFYLNFADNSGTTSTTLGKDGSGNGNNWTPNNFSVTAGSGNDSMIDTPTPYADDGNGRGNYCTLNPLDRHGALFYNGNLDFYMYGQYGGMQCSGNWGMTAGKWYWECTMTDLNSFAYYPINFRVGMCVTGSLGIPTYSIPVTWNMSGGVGTGYGTVIANGFSYTTGDILQLAFDQSSGKLWFGKNGTWSNAGNPAAGTGANIENIPTSILFSPAADHQIQINYSLGSFNFGQRPFAYAPPAGFLALNTQNLPEPTIKKPSSYMDVVTYTGTGSALTPTSNLGFSPDLVWIKSRSAATDHALYDVIRGAEKRLESNNMDAEVTTDSGVTAFNSAGFTLGTLAQVNTNAATYVAWCWDESATPGFDIVTYTGTGSVITVAHSLGVAPNMMIVKRRTEAIGEWWVYHSTLGAAKGLALNSISAEQTSSLLWNNTAPTSATFSLGTGSDVNASGGTYVAYLWSEVAGFSKFGSYTGNGSTDGPFVYCGFRPRWVMMKGSSLASHWYTFDAARNESNVTSSYLYPNLSHAEYAEPCLDFTSNGFKWRSNSAAFNASGHTYIFAAFAETPAKYSLAR